jgi:cell division septation protein DedD
LIHFLNLEPLSVEETQQYLNHRLTASGWQNENPMSEEIVARIFRLSEGNAARINRIARRFLLDMLNDQDNAEQKTFGKKYMTRLLGGCLIVAFLALIGVWAWRANNESPASVPARPSILVNGQPLVHHGETQASAIEPLAPPPPATPTSSAVLPITNLNTPAATAVAPTPVSATPPPLPSTATLPTEKVVTAPTPAKAALASSVAPSQKPKVKAIDKESSGKYSIQLIALSHSQNVNQFIKQNHLQGKVTVIKTQKQGKPVTVVLYGRYKTLREAEKDIAHLPPNLLNAGPWPREVPGK